jgi:uncharacterized protein YidB (DUF937 family)
MLRRDDFAGRDKELEADMGLLDILNSIQNTLPPGGGMPTGPRGQAGPGSGAESQGMSPIAKALLALLAAYAVKNMQRSGPAPTQQPGGKAGGGLGDVLGSVLGGGSGGPAGGAGGDLGGGLGDILKGPLGGILGGATAGTILNGGLGDLLKQFQDAGQGEVAKSWVGTGQNKAISQGDLASALGSDTINQLTGETGMSRDQLLSGLSQHLPRFVDQLTPNGRLPTEAEAARLL